MSRGVAGDWILKFFFFYILCLNAPSSNSFIFWVGIIEITCKRSLIDWFTIDLVVLRYGKLYIRIRTQSLRKHIDKTLRKFRIPKNNGIINSNNQNDFKWKSQSLACFGPQIFRNPTSVKWNNLDFMHPINDLQSITKHIDVMPCFHEFCSHFLYTCSEDK